MTWREALATIDRTLATQEEQLASGLRGDAQLRERIVQLERELASERARCCKNQRCYAELCEDCQHAVDMGELRQCGDCKTYARTEDSTSCICAGTENAKKGGKGDANGGGD